MNELINKDNEWIIHFMGSLDRLLDNYERLTATTARHWWRTFLHRQRGIGTVESEPKNTSRLPQ